jgi:hypothetical protein
VKVAILGCGPAGLMAAAAVRAARPAANIHILSIKRKSALYGAQYLHAPIPGYTDEDNFIDVNYQMKGDPSDYRRKVYGPTWDGSVSPEDLEETHKGWDLRETYERLWEDYGTDIYNVNIDPAGLRWIVDGKTDWGNFDLIISSLYASSICPDSHHFKSMAIRAAGDAPEIGVSLPYTNCPENTVICNGEDHPSWYRMSNIFGRRTVEWPHDIMPPIHHAEVLKPLGTNCDCWPGVLRVGRYGRWEKGVLTHDAYFDVLEALA